jgi:hypothetical protein
VVTRRVERREGHVYRLRCVTGGPFVVFANVDEGDGARVDHLLGGGGVDVLQGLGHGILLHSVMDG